MKAKDVMTRHVISVAPDDSILKALRLMLGNKISGLPVVDQNGTLLGIVTEGDFLRRTETGTERRRPRWLEFLVGPGTIASDYVHSHARRIDEVMTSDVRTVTEDAPLGDIEQGFTFGVGAQHDRAGGRGQVGGERAGKHRFASSR